MYHLDDPVVLMYTTGLLCNDRQRLGSDLARSGHPKADCSLSDDGRPDLGVLLQDVPTVTSWSLE
jgi:hypothetical protein